MSRHCDSAASYQTRKIRDKSFPGERTSFFRQNVIFVVVIVVVVAVIVVIVVVFVVVVVVVIVGVGVENKKVEQMSRV